MNKEGLCVSYIILACSIFICSGFAFWLYTDSDIEKLRDYRAGYDMLLLYERFEDAKKFHSEMLASIYDDEIWWNLIYDEDNGYAKLQLYSRLLADNPDLEKIYKDIAAILGVAPEEFSTKEKTKYLASLKEIRGVHIDWLEKYELVLSVDDK